MKLYGILLINKEDKKAVCNIMVSRNGLLLIFGGREYWSSDFFEEVREIITKQIIKEPLWKKYSEAIELYRVLPDYLIIDKVWNWSEMINENKIVIQGHTIISCPIMEDANGIRPLTIEPGEDIFDFKNGKYIEYVDKKGNHYFYKREKEERIINLHGKRTKEQILRCVRDIVGIMNQDLREMFVTNVYKQLESNSRMNTLIEIIAAETGFGVLKGDDENELVGICQIDKAKFDIAKENGIKNFKTLIWEKMRIDISQITIEQLRYDEYLAILVQHLYFRSLSLRVANSRAKRAENWIKYFHASKRNKTIEYYMEMCEKYIGEVTNPFSMSL